METRQAYIDKIAMEYRQKASAQGIREVSEDEWATTVQNAVACYGMQALVQMAQPTTIDKL